MWVCMWVCAHICQCRGGQKNPLELVPRGCWELNLGSLQEQQAHLTTESSLQAQLCILCIMSRLFQAHPEILVLQGENNQGGKGLTFC